MTGMKGVARRDLERLSAYLDDELDPAEAEKLEARLKTDAHLSGMLEALRATVAVVGGLPDVRPPHTFALTEEMVRPRRAYPILQLSTAVAALGFVLVVGADLLLSNGGSRALDVPEQAFFAADELAAQSEPQMPDSALEEAPGLEGTVMEQAAGAQATATVTAPEAEAEAVEDADVGPAPGFLRADEAAVPEGLAGQGAAEQGAVVEEEGALKASAEPEPLAEELPAPGNYAEEEPSDSLAPLRVIEISLAAVVILLVGLTLWVRQRG